MPGPKSKSKAKPKRKTASQPATPAKNIELLSSLLEQIDNAGWKDLVEMLCAFFSLPDISTRHGLKKVHANFDTIYEQLDTAYKQSSGNEKLMGGIVGIYAKLSADSLLRDKLFEKGFLDSLIPLLDIPSCCHLALQALCTVTHHGDHHGNTRKTISQKTPILIRLLEEQPSDAKICELAITIITHAVGAVMDGTSEPDPKLWKLLDLPNLFRILVSNLRKQTASRYMIDHALGFLYTSVVRCSKEIQALPSSLDFLVACLRSRELDTRCIGLGAIIRLYHNEAEEEDHIHDPQSMIAAAQRGYPPHLSDPLKAYGFERCEAFVVLKTCHEFQSAMMKCLQDSDLYKLGLTISELILRTEFSITDGTFKSQDPLTQKLEDIDTGLPFKMWSDALPHCANAIRAKGIASEADMADIIEVKYYVTKRRLPAAFALAKKALERNPNVAFYYYVLSLTNDIKEGLRYAKKGLKCSKLTPYVRFGMLYRATEHAGDLGLSILHGATADEKRREEGVAFLMSAWEDSKVYVSEASPDARMLKNALYWYILLTLAIRGPEINADLRELQNALERLKLAEEYSSFIGRHPPNTELRLAEQKVTQRYTAAAKVWGDVIARYDGSSDGSLEKAINPSKAIDDLAAWLNDEHLEDQETHPDWCSHPKININRVELYRCSWCGNPSAVLRKCSGCGKSRYCDMACQKSHWTKHKPFCEAD